MRLVRPGDAGYDEGRRVFNGMIDRRPALIAICETADDVRRALERAASDGLPVSVRGGGHNVAGNGVCEGGLVIHLGGMRGVRVDAASRLAWAGGGATWGDFDAATQAHGLATPGGIVSSTGLAGLTLGGGIGVLRGKHGLTCDNLVGAEMVTAGGDLVTADAELLWALRGGGGNFGVVTSFEFVVYPQGEVVAGPVEFAYDDPRGFLRFYREYCAGLPDEMSCDLLLRSGADGEPRITLLTCWTGDLDRAPAVYAALRARNPINDAAVRRSYVEAQRTYDAISPWGQRNYWKSNGMAELSDGAIEVLVASCDGRRSPLAQIQLEHLHGQVHRTDPASAAVGFHGATYNLLFNAKWLDPAADAENLAWARDSFAAIQPHLAGGAYVNYLLAEPEERIRAAYGPEIYDRLARVKARYDPHNILRLNQNIRPAESAHA
ncbi:MAG: FAD-binding oxidoreductase [Chloroflexi bacterium]|nr:MAG: FAD-binding oxidoreductase [Chloroflexota bacterium]